MLDLPETDECVGTHIQGDLTSRNEMRVDACAIQRERDVWRERSEMM